MLDLNVNAWQMSVFYNNKQLNDNNDNNGASQPPVVVTAGASIYATQSKQPYRSNPIEYVSKTVSPLNILLPEVIRDYETFSVTVELHSSSGEIVQSVVNNDACINLITGSCIIIIITTIYFTYIYKQCGPVS